MTRTSQAASLQRWLIDTQEDSMGISVSNAIGRFVDHRLSRHFQIVTDANDFYRQQCDFVLSIEDYPLDVRVDVERGRTQKADQGLIAFARKLNRKTRRRRD